MPPTTDLPETGIEDALNRLAASSAMQSNCLFQLALMLARIAAEPCAESYKAEAAQAVMDLIRAKPKGNVVRLFGTPQASPADEALRANVVHLGAR